MKNFKLNFGGIYGGIICAGGAFVLVYLLANNGGIPPRAFKLIGLAAFGGAALGNWIWKLALPSEPENPAF